MRWAGCRIRARRLLFLVFSNLPGLGVVIYPVSCCSWRRASRLIWLRSRGDWQRRYLDYRVLAEALRVQFYWAIAGVERSGAESLRPRRVSQTARPGARLDSQHSARCGSTRRRDRRASRPIAGIAIAVRDWVGRRAAMGYYRRRWPEKRRATALPKRSDARRSRPGLRWRRGLRSLSSGSNGNPATS